MIWYDYTSYSTNIPSKVSRLKFIRMLGLLSAVIFRYYSTLLNDIVSLEITGSQPVKCYAC